MGRMVDGQWTTTWYIPNAEGHFQRPETRFRDAVSSSPGARFDVAPGRYHLYLSEACPWAHRVMLMRRLRGLEEALSVTYVAPLMLDDGWHFREDVPDPHRHGPFLRDVYAAADSRYTGRVTVPILWDRQERTIVNNESREIVRMLNTVFDPLASRPGYYMERMHTAIEEAIDGMYETINNGVYRTGFATSQAAYHECVDALFEALDEHEAKLAESRYLCGDVLTEADWFLFTTLIRFDPVYHGHFKCNIRRIVDYPNLWGFVRELYQLPGVAETCHFDAIKQHYYGSHPTINPNGIVARGSWPDLWQPHGRG